MKTVLLAVGLELHEQHLLRQAVRGVGLLRVAVPEVLFTKRDRRKLRIGAHGPEDHRLRHAKLPRQLDELDPHDRVVVEECPRPQAIRLDSPADRREMDDERWLERLQRAPRGDRVPQVALRAARGEDRAVATRLEPGQQMAAEETVAPGHENPLFRPETHWRNSLKIPSRTTCRQSRGSRFPCRRRTSASTMSRTSSLKRTFGLQPSWRSVFEGSPTRRSTSLGRS